MQRTTALCNGAVQCRTFMVQQGFSADGLAVRMAAEKKNTDIAAGLLNQGKAMDR